MNSWVDSDLALESTEGHGRCFGSRNRIVASALARLEAATSHRLDEGRSQRTEEDLVVEVASPVEAEGSHQRSEAGRMTCCQMLEMCKEDQKSQVVTEGGLNSTSEHSRFA